MKKLIVLFALFSHAALADFDSATWALMDEDKIQYMSQRDSLGLQVLIVGLENDGTDRDGYAEYICQVLIEHKVSQDVLVKIIDADTWATAQEEKLIGSHSCKHAMALPS